ncbi:MAG: hypothetical protein AAF004_00615 [Pseudomonadota bacterium]
MKLPAELPDTVCWMPFCDAVDTLYQWRERHAPQLMLRSTLPRGVRLHDAVANVSTQPAAWRLLGEASEPDVGQAQWCASLDPVSFVADQRDVRIAAWPVSALSLADSKEIARAVATHLSGDPDVRLSATQLHVSVAQRWYLTGSGDMPDVINALPEQVVGQPLRDFPTTGGDARLWKRLSTELQMLLHSHEVNGQRADAGLSPVNGVWWHGSSALPLSSQPLTLPPLASTDVFWRGCWRAHKASLQPFVETLPESPGGIAVAGNAVDTLACVADALRRDTLRAAVISVADTSLTLSKMPRWRRMFSRGQR